MIRFHGKLRHISPAQRGIIVQRVLIDGWSLAEAAASSGIAESRVADWLAAYRRRGMASLREDAAIERPPRRWLWLLRITLLRITGARGRPDGSSGRAVQLLRRDGKNPERPPGDDRRSHRR